MTLPMTSAVAPEVFLARQLVVDADRHPFGYELLYRGGPDRATAFDDPDAATRGVMERVLLQWGMEHLVGDNFGLVNATANLVVHGLHRAMPPEGMLFEIGEPTPFDDTTIDAIRQARYEGYHFALDNVSRLGELEYSNLLPLASIVKVELNAAHDAEIERLIGVARERSPGVLVVASKVESVTDFKRSVDHGFDLFQGYYVSEPEVLRRPARPASRSAQAALAAVFDDTHLDVAGFTTIVSAEPTLAFRLLAALNASAFGLDRDVDSLEHAMGMLGHDKLRCVAELIATSTDTTEADEATSLGAARAIMAAELVAGTDDVGGAVTVALLSACDAAFGASMADLLAELPVTAEVTGALLLGHGRLGRTLEVIRACERNDRATLADLAPGRADELCAMRATASVRALGAAPSPPRNSARVSR